jgi:hypothetical protein
VEPHPCASFCRQALEHCNVAHHEARPRHWDAAPCRTANLHDDGIRTYCPRFVLPVGVGQSRAQQRNKISIIISRGLGPTTTRGPIAPHPSGFLEAS